MKITKPLRHSLSSLAWLIIGMAGIMVIPFCRRNRSGSGGSLSVNAKVHYGRGFRNAFGYFTYKWRDCVEKAPIACFMYMRLIKRWFASSPRPLEGADTKECRRLRSELRITLDKHCRNYPSESGFSDIVQYRDYLKRLEKVKKVH